jgi:hypothetical protein
MPPPEGDPFIPIVNDHLNRLNNTAGESFRTLPTARTAHEASGIRRLTARAADHLRVCILPFNRRSIKKRVAFPDGETPRTPYGRVVAGIICSHLRGCQGGIVCWCLRAQARMTTYCSVSSIRTAPSPRSSDSSAFPSIVALGPASRRVCPCREGSSLCGGHCAEPVPDRATPDQSGLNSGIHGDSTVEVESLQHVQLNEGVPFRATLDGDNREF